jgi:cell division protein FtsX
MVAYAVVGLTGALISVLILWWRYGLLMGLLAAPFRARSLVLGLAILLALHSDNRSR